MNQKINIEVMIPEEYVLITKIELEELKEREYPEWTTGLKWLENQTGMSTDYLKKKLLYPYKDELIDFVDYPKEGQRMWRFNNYYMKNWLRNNFKRVLK